jgi:NCS1 family nucleobase:cation symporter-1
VNIKLLDKDAIPAWITHLYNYAWFVGFLISGLIYMALMRSAKIQESKTKDNLYVAAD